MFCLYVRTCKCYGYVLIMASTDCVLVWSVSIKIVSTCSGKPIFALLRGLKQSFANTSHSAQATSFRRCKWILTQTSHLISQPFFLRLRNRPLGTYTEVCILTDFKVTSRFVSPFWIGELRAIRHCVSPLTAICSVIGCNSDTCCTKKGPVSSCPHALSVTAPQPNKHWSMSQLFCPRVTKPQRTRNN